MPNRFALLLASLAIVAASTALAAPHRSGAAAPADATRLASAAIATPVDDDPDLPAPMVGLVDKDAYLQARDAAIAQLRGLADFTFGENPRLLAIETMKAQQKALGPVSAGYWTPLGPSPIPNGQTTTTAYSVSGTPERESR